MGSKHRRATIALLILTIAAGGRQMLAALPTEDSVAAPAVEAPTPAECVQSAIAAESRADRDQRDRLIEQALRADANFAPARWQAGQVRYDDRWLSIDEALAKAEQDELLAQYRKIRAKHRSVPDAPQPSAAKTPKDGDDPVRELMLARWCQKHHLADETRAHATQLLASRSNDPEVLKMLGLTWHQGQLITAAELAERKARDEQDRHAMQHWRPIVAQICRQIESQSASEHADGLGQLHAIDDPDAVEALVAVCKPRPALLCEAIHVIGQIPGQQATDALLRQAVMSKDNEVIAAACQELKARSIFGYVPKLMAALSAPVQTRHYVVQDATGVHFRETVQREGEKGVVVKTVDTEVSFLVPNPNLEEIIGQAYAETVVDARGTARTAARLNQKLASYNAAIYRVLDATVGESAPHEPVLWWDWWHKYAAGLSGQRFKKPVSLTAYHRQAYVPYVPVSFDDSPHIRRTSSCFARGTKVWALDGPKPIEQVQIGDRVLSQSPWSGELTFKPVLDTTLGHNDLLTLVTANGDLLVATPVHIFWVSGAGWRMTKELHVGDRLHTTSGWSELTSIEPLAADETHNLVVADFNTYFVGESRILTHDVTIPETVTGGVPGELAR
ncbi:MAG TPA: polymorphic toxin-type HINT domain-containing protein [Pirellulales bacterium]|jgi:hypothetical protein|nr:polymorphic toxin-type HINT domain-containing protein [Pirellulales bacterium]